jgi:hypothetical protein
MPKKSSTVPKLAIGCKVFSYSTKPFDLEIGGRNQNTQLCLNECVGGGVADFESVRDAFEVLVPRSLICFSTVGVLAAAPTTLLKSSAPPGVFGVLEDPKDAKAPDPKPKALAAPAVGEARELVEGLIALKGFLLLCEDESPCRLPSV